MRPVTKALYGLLHWWFDASEGRPIEKDTWQCAKSLALRGLIDSRDQALDRQCSGRTRGYSLPRQNGAIERRLLTTLGFRRGEAIRANLASINPFLPNKSKPLAVLEQGTGGSLEAGDGGELTVEALNALRQLNKLGTSPAEAKRLLQTNNPGKILDMIEYVSYKVTELLRR